MPFYQPRQKIVRAKHHIEVLESAIKDYFLQEWHETSFNFNKETRQYELKVGVKSPPDLWSSIMGDAIHNLRSALDLMAVELAQTNPKNDHSVNGVRFPFCRTQSDLPEMIKRAKFKRTGQECVDEIFSLKPYKGGNDALRALHDLDVLDKHVLLISTQTTITTPEIGIVMEKDGITPKRFKEGKLVMELKGDPIPSVEFIFPDDLPLAGQLVIPTLHDFVQTVSAIIDRFDAIRTASIW